MTELRPGEIVLPDDPALASEAGVVFIGQIGSPWSPDDYPKSMRVARSRGGGGRVTLAEPYRPGLIGLSVGQSVVLFYWMHAARRDLIVQSPRHADGPRGVFAIRSPVRPNPIAMSCVTITTLHDDGFDIDAIDCFDGTPLVDIKPWLEGIDSPPADQGELVE